MTETETTGPTVRTIYPDEQRGPQIREVGNNPPPDDSAVTRVDASRGFLPRLGRVFWPGAKARRRNRHRRGPRFRRLKNWRGSKRSCPTSTASLPRHKQSWRRTPGPTPPRPRPCATSSASYRAQLASGADVAAMPMVDVALLRDVLHTIDGRGMLDTTAARIGQLTEQLRVPEAPKGQHKKLIVAAETALRNFGLAYRALRAFEAKGAATEQRHRFRNPRPTCGMNFAQLSETELRKAAEFGEALPVESK